MLGTSFGMNCYLKLRGRNCCHIHDRTEQDAGSAAQAFVEAVHAGDIFWHAMPFNTQVELFDGPLLQYAVEMTHELDAKFGQKPKRTMSQVISAPAYQACTRCWGTKVLARKGCSAGPQTPLCTNTITLCVPHWIRAVEWMFCPSQVHAL
jgi:hypothetical protein